MCSQTRKTVRAADGLLTGLKQMGVDYIFGNTGTDYPPIIGSLGRFQQAGEIGKSVPHTVTVPHENVAVHMAYGAYLATGNPQVVMVHTNVGTANTLNGIINANRAQVPMIIIAGRAPVTEAFDHTSKPGFIHWGQEMFDQASMVRENVKWDYHISSDNVVELDLILQRAVGMATAYPPGPVYLTFVPESMERMVDLPEQFTPPTPVSKPQPDVEQVNQIGRWLAEAERPVLVTGGTSRDHTILPALVALAEHLSLPVASLNPRNLHFPFNHPLYLGRNPHKAVVEADFIINLETDVPYMPIHGQPLTDTRVVHIGPEPLFQRYPRRGYRSDAFIASDSAAFLNALQAATTPPSTSVSQQRTTWANGLREAEAAARQRQVEQAQQSGVMNFGWISKCIADVVDDDIIVFREFDLNEDYLNRDQPGTYFGQANAGGLGWGMGCALGFRLANPEKVVLTTTGDGCYYFNAPAAAHSVANAQNLPGLTIVFNNAKWGTVVRHTNRWYAELEEPNPPLTSLGPHADFQTIIEAFGGYGERVERPTDLPAALERALHEVKANGRQALINVIC
ncbi:MAG: thiamine pyrophosphate-requiring protein [Chloroflexota bacterium]